MKPIKILVTAPNLITGGAEKQLIYLINGLVNEGFNIALLVFDLEGEYIESVSKRIKIITPKSPKPGKILKGFWKIKEIMTAISEEKPDILYSRLWPTKAATAFAAMLSRKKLVFSEDRSIRRYIKDEYGKSKSSFDLYLKKNASKQADVIVPVSQAIGDELVQIFGLDSEHVKLIYNGFNLEELRQKGAEEVNHPWLLDRQEPVIGALGRMVEVKGFKYLLEAMRIIADRGIAAKLIMIGKGEILEELKAKAESLNIKDRVDFLGFTENPFAYLAKCDAFVLSSLYEGLPSTLIEAMALGVPVISTRCPTGPEEIIDHERNGLLIPVADSQAIADSVIRLLGDKQLNETMKVEGKKRADYFSLENMISRFAEMFISLVK